MPLLRLLTDFSLYKFDQTFIRRLDLSISLSIIWGRIQQFDIEAIGNFLELFRNKCCALISSESLRNTKPVNNMLLNEINNILRGNFIVWYCLNPLGKVISSNQYEFMPFTRRRINLSYHINPPPSKRPRLDDGIHSRCRRPLNITKLLAVLTPFIILKTVF